MCSTEKLAEANRKFASLKSELSASAEHMESPSKDLSQPRRRRLSTVFISKDRKNENNPHHVRNMHEIKLAFSEFYLGLILLQNYQTLNFTGSRKILKKHDKVSGHKRSEIPYFNFFFLETGCSGGFAPV